MTAPPHRDGLTAPVSAPTGGSLAVAYSGGRDSTALLHAAAAAAVGAGLEVHALHVHHGLSIHADDWLAHCERQCARWAASGLPVHFHAERLALAPARGESVEAAARIGRYAALRRMALAAGTDLVLLAHHRRDQAETLLLQALRGAGVAGLAGMPAEIWREGVTWSRPWLAQPSEAVAAYVRHHRLRHIVDDSNADPRFARNRLRLSVWPALSEAFPGAEAALADAATWAQQANAAMADLARIDLEACCRGEDLGLGLDLGAWRQLAPHRAAHALRAWLCAASGRMPGAADLQRLIRELPGAAPSTWRLCGGRLTRYRGRLRFASMAEAAGAPLPSPTTPLRESALAIRRAGRYPLPGWGGVLVAQRVPEGGAPLARLATLELRPRSGGERFGWALGRPARSLKKQYQSAGVAAWQREGPLLYSGGALVFVPGLGLDAAAQAAPGEPQLALAWELAD
jgi:tRNA(Ile)-lysidine synthase